ncbi:MAG: GntR family transcriptional regulator [Fimbriimonas sp.]
MRIHILSNDGVPIYLQIVQQVRRQIACGELREGEELPSIRALAERLMVNPNTIARAYRELEAAGVVTSSRGLGTYVAGGDARLAESEKQAVLAERIDALVVESIQMGVPLPALLRLVEERAAAFRAPDEIEIKAEASRG